MKRDRTGEGERFNRRFDFPPPPPARLQVVGAAVFFSIPMALLGGMATLDSGSPFGPIGGMIVGAIAGAIMGARIGMIEDEN